jgi:hypothetical protein
VMISMLIFIGRSDWLSKGSMLTSANCCCVSPDRSGPAAALGVHPPCRECWRGSEHEQGAICGAADDETEWRSGIWGGPGEKS